MNLLFLKRMLAAWNRSEREKINENWADIERGFSAANTAINTAQETAEDGVTRAKNAQATADDATKIANGIDGKATEALNKSNQAVSTSNTARDTAQQAKETAEYVQSQLDDVVVSGDNIEEVVQARGGKKNLRERLDSENDEITEVLAHKNETDLRTRNALLPLDIPTYENSGQTTHPSVLYFKDKFLGWNYWLAHTPYPNSNDDWENPSICVSQNGMDWVNFSGLTNPIDEPTPEEIAEGGHMSDAVLAFANGRLECWYRLNKTGTNSYEKILRKTTVDGKNWSDREIVLDYTGTKLFALSPTVLFEDGKYKMWYVGSQDKVYYIESATGELNTWSDPQVVTLNFRDDNIYTPWHIDVFRDDDGLYKILLNTWGKNNSESRVLLLGTAKTETVFDDLHLILEPCAESWDGNMIYRACTVKVDGMYKVYYSARSLRGVWGIGLIKAKNLDALAPTGLVQGNLGVVLDKLRTRELAVYKRGTGAAIITPHNNNTLALHNESKSALINLLIRTLIATTVESQSVKAEDIIAFKQGVGAAIFSPKSVDLIALYDQYKTRLVGLELKDLIATAIASDRTTSKELIVLNQGVGAGRFVSEEKDTITLYNQSTNTNNVTLQVGALQLLDSIVVNRPGALKYNTVNKKAVLWTSESEFTNLNNYRTEIPSSKTAFGLAGDYAADANYLYVCYSTNQWLRITKDSW